MGSKYNYMWSINFHLHACNNNLLNGLLQRKARFFTKHATLWTIDKE